MAHEHSDLNRIAAHWVARLTSGDADGRDVAGAGVWCQQSAEHRAAFENARRVWQLATHPAPATAATERKNPAPRWHTFAAAAAVVMAVGIGFMAVQGGWTADHRTGAGEQRRVVLDDGSAILMDAATALDVDYSSDRRSIRLRKGQALFEVARDAKRPFVVESEQLTARAVGTVYSVRRDGDDARVVVKEGVVEVSAPGVAPAVIEAGEMLTHSDESVSLTRRHVDMNEALGWERGRLVFELTPLEQVVSEINRRRPGYLVIANGALRQRKVNGVFNLNHLDDGLQTLESAFAIRRATFSPYLIVLY